MSNSLIQETTDTNFEFEVMRSTQPVLVDCWSRGCRPCEQMLPWLDEAAASYDGRLKIVRMNVDDSHRVAAKLGVRALPTLMLFDRGEMRGLSVGALSKAEVRAFIEGHMRALEASSKGRSKSPEERGPHADRDDRNVLTEHAKVLILGAGPSGYAAAVHAARANLRPLLIAASSNHLENSAAHTSWPSDIDVVIGPVMKERLRDHAERASTRMIVDNIASVDLSVRPFLLRGHKSNYSCDALIIAVDCLADTNLFSGQLDTHADRITTRIGLSGAHTLSSQRGVFIAGDVGAPQYSEVITSVGTGGLAVLDARRFLGH